MSQHEEPQDDIPVFRSWSGWYWLVMGVMFFQLALYLWITLSFA